MSSFPITLIAAVARNGVIGRNNAMIWHIRSEFAHLRASTMGKPVIMGRKTFESIGKALPVASISSSAARLGPVFPELSASPRWRRPLLLPMGPACAAVRRRS